MAQVPSDLRLQGAAERLRRGAAMLEFQATFLELHAVMEDVPPDIARRREEAAQRILKLERKFSRLVGAPPLRALWGSIRAVARDALPAGIDALEFRTGQAAGAFLSLY